MDSPIPLVDLLQPTRLDFNSFLQHTFIPCIDTNDPKSICNSLDFFQPPRSCLAFSFSISPIDSKLLGARRTMRDGMDRVGGCAGAMIQCRCLSVSLSLHQCLWSRRTLWGVVQVFWLIFDFNANLFSCVLSSRRVL